MVAGNKTEESMPSTWTAYAKRKSTCQAEELKDDKIYGCWEILPKIDEGEIIVRVRQTTKTVDFHPQCWYKTAIEIMKLTPYAPAGKGRRKLPITDEESKERKKLSSRYSAFQTRINAYQKRIMDEDINSTDLTYSVQIMKLKQDQIWISMKDIGGAPERWRIPNEQEQSRGEDPEKVLVDEVPFISNEGAPLAPAAP